MTPDPPVTLYAEFTALPGREHEVSELVTELTAHVRNEPGNVFFVAHRKRDAPDQFVIYEEYVNQAAFDAHLAYQHGIVFNRALTTLVVNGGSTVVFLDKQ